MDEDRDDLTGREEEIQEETNTSGEEAHRIGEFRDLRDKMDTLLDSNKTLLDRLDSIARALATRTVETDTPKDETEDFEDYTDPRERDYSL